MVAIKDFGMPNVCYMCPILDGEYGRCKIIGETQCDMTEERAKCCPLVESIPKDQYEARLKADLEAILVELQLEIEEIKIDNNVPSGFEPVSKTSAFYEGVSASSKVIQQKINALKADQEGEE
jgi:hypothetical protein